MKRDILLVFSRFRNKQLAGKEKWTLPSFHLEDCTFYGKQLMDGDLTKRNKVFVSYQSHFLSYVKGQSVASL